MKYHFKFNLLQGFQLVKNELENVAGIRGFEPLNAEIKTRCLTAWRYPNRYFKEFILLRTCRDPILKSCGVLPLGDIPITIFKSLISWLAPNCFFKELNFSDWILY